VENNDGEDEDGHGDGDENGDDNDHDKVKPEEGRIAEHEQASNGDTTADECTASGEQVQSPEARAQNSRSAIRGSCT